MVIKENIVKCEVCEKPFNNYYKNGRIRKFTCSRECSGEFRRRYQVEHNRKKRRQRRAEHRCIICGKKVKPVIVYHQYCLKHKYPKKK